MGIYDVPATELINNIAKDLKTKVQQPDFVSYVKTGAHRERSPLNSDWWYVRSASILYRVYKDGPVGTESLRTYYGGKKNRGVKPHQFRKAGGKIIRTCLQNLEKQGLIKKEKKGRIITPKGHKYLNQKSKETLEELKTKPKKEKPKLRLATSMKQTTQTESKKGKPKKEKKDSKEKK